MNIESITKDGRTREFHTFLPCSWSLFLVLFRSIQFLGACELHSHLAAPVGSFQWAFKGAARSQLL